MDVKKVAAADDIVFEEAGITIAKGTRYCIETVTEQGVILYTDEGDRFLLDFITFENGFVAVS